MRHLIALVASLALLIVAWPAEARLTRAVSLDGDIASAARVFIGTVTEETVVEADAPGPFGSRVAMLELNVLVQVAFTHSKAGEDVTVHHMRVLPDSPPTINGFSPVELTVGAAYLFFLAPRDAGGLELVAIEDSSIVTVPDLAPVAASAKKEKSPLTRAVASLVTLTRKCNDTCAGAIWLLSRSQELALDQAKTKKRRQVLATNLLRIVASSKDDNTLGAAYTELGRQSFTVVIPRIVRAACKPDASLNTINWLQGFGPRQQTGALQKIVARAKEQSVIDYARRRLDALKK